MRTREKGVLAPAPAPEDIELNNLLFGPPILIKKGTVAGIHVTWERVPKNKFGFPEVVVAPPCISLPTIFAPFKKHF